MIRKTIPILIDEREGGAEHACFTLERPSSRKESLHVRDSAADDQSDDEEAERYPASASLDRPLTRGRGRTRLVSLPELGRRDVR